MQCQVQMHVTGIGTCYYFRWSPEKTKLQVLIYDEKFMDESLKYLDEYYCKVFVKEYFNSKDYGF